MQTSEAERQLLGATGKINALQNQYHIAVQQLDQVWVPCKYLQWLRGRFFTIVVSIIHRIIKLQRRYHLLKVKYRGYSFDQIYATVSYSSAKGKSFTIFAVYKHFQLCVLKGKCLNMHKTYKLGFTVQHHYLFLYYTFECTCWENVILWVLFLY